MSGSNSLALTRRLPGSFIVTASDRYGRNPRSAPISWTAIQAGSHGEESHVADEVSRLDVGEEFRYVGDGGGIIEITRVS